MNYACSIATNTALRVRDSSPGSGTAGLSSGQGFADGPFMFARATNATPAATPSGSNTFVLRLRLQAVTPSGSDTRANEAAAFMTPEGSQPVDQKRPHATTTPEGSQPEFRVRDSSGKPGAASSPRGLVANSPTALHLNAGTPYQPQW